MKKIQHILIIFFLLGMLFTVLQYLPFLEEESPGHRTELSKKAKGSHSQDNDEGGDGDDDSDGSDKDDVKADLFYNLLNNYFFYHATKDKFHIKAQLYQSLVANINTPPPKA